MSGYREGRKRKRSVRPDVSGTGHWPLKLEKKKDCVKSGCTGDLSALAAVIFNGKSMHISVYNDVTVSTSITCKLMTRPKLSRTVQQETPWKVEKTIMICTLFLMIIIFK